MTIKELTEFIQLFTDTDIGVKRAIKLNKAIYLPNSSAQLILDKTPEEPVSTGLFLGSIKPTFKASITLLRMIAPHTTKKIVLNEKAAWLFVCGRDAFPNNILKGDSNSKMVIVQNEDGEVLGLALRTPSMYKNIMHIGELLKNK